MITVQEAYDAENTYIWSVICREPPNPLRARSCEHLTDAHLVLSLVGARAVRCPGDQAVDADTRRAADSKNGSDPKARHLNCPAHCQAAGARPLELLGAARHGST